MDLSFSEVQTMLTDSVEKFIANDYPFEKRQAYAASEHGFSADVWQTFADLGWTAVPFAEEDGGFDGGPIELMVMMQQFGRGLIVEPYLANRPTFSPGPYRALIPMTRPFGLTTGPPLLPGFTAASVRMRVT